MTQLDKVKKIVKILKRKSLGENDTERIYIAYLIIEALDEPPTKVVSIGHAPTCPAYGNFQPPYQDCNCGYDK